MRDIYLIIIIIILITIQMSLIDIQKEIREIKRGNHGK
ncbi:hypothetical protein J2S72_000432 [Peptoniphilus koenoeneniae]|uniref:Uncharacterized protein n=1 Tax=Peptoniphilus koenoeneniae TaxID=507751 RepID=A0ABU0AT28_9FIRM|nr:hypothetical protein HMPREF1253_1854 [Peptoniphilus sp. BV3C26]MDQ0274424.1 hypothetical protein [Peptoniphilus koenoeneniae]